MSKIVFFCIPAHGHTNPTLPVVRELVSRGHEVWYYSYNMFREKIESAGATFVSCDDYDTEKKLNAKDSARIGRDLAFSTKILVDTTLALDDKVCKEMEEIKPDCIVADSMALWGKAVAMKLGISLVSSTTTLAFNEHSAKIMKQGLFDLIKMLISLPGISKQINRLKNKGYPVNNILDIIGNDNNIHTIVYTSPSFQPCSETFSEKYAFVGPSIREPMSEIEKTRDKLVYISLGTVNNNMVQFYKACISALADTDYQVIMSVGNSVSIENLGKLPENISVFSHIDQIAVLKQSDVFLTHCGMNSTSEGLYFSVPLVMFPRTTEQKGVAARVSELGAGILLDELDSDSVRDTINRIFCDKSYKENAQKISVDFRNCSGAKGAADKILKTCNNAI